MSRKPRHVPTSLNPLPVKHLPDEEIRIILRGADDLIMSGGRTLLAKILKGSRDKKILALKLDKSPVYGTYREHTIDDITARVDWLIVHDYLRIEYDYRLPLLVYSPQGWAIERETYTDEVLGHINQWLASPEPTPDVSWLNEKNREVILLLLDRIEASRDSRYLPLLEAWASNTFRKVAKRIRQVIEALSGAQ